MKAADASRAKSKACVAREPGTIFVTIGAVIVCSCHHDFLASLGWALVVFVAGKLLGGAGRCSFGKAYEITGLAFVIGILWTIVATGLILLRDSLTQPSGALFVEDLDPGNKLHNLLQALNPFTVWMVAVLAIGLACSSGIPIRKAIIAFFGFWTVKASILIAIGYGQLA